MIKSREQNPSWKPSSRTENIKHGEEVWEEPFRWILSLAIWLQFLFSHHISKAHSNMLHLRLDFSRWFLTSGFLTKKISIDLSFHLHYPPNSSTLISYSNNVWWRVQITTNFQDLESDIVNDLGGHLRDVILALLQAPQDFVADNIHATLKVWLRPLLCHSFG